MRGVSIHAIELLSRDVDYEFDIGSNTKGTVVKEVEIS